ncbi:unnamed protein product [Coffea canephora]|uniref:non-specific serine/threonine protein kinase n=1 Tax=Coffea canephora TaxID=49390 RepID=A0A068TWF3_COFCA|nr:unnamed protein product [Coffea canephora]
MDKASLLLLVFYKILFILPVYCAPNDSITPSQPLKVGQTLISTGQIFELGFFSPGKASELYIGIWYKIDPDRRIVWVANRGNALLADDLASRLIISSDGNLKLMDGKQDIVWSTNASVQSNTTIAVLTDDGDFILKDKISGATLWESFYYPSDTILATMQLGFNGRSGQKSFLTSWENDKDPAPGKFVVGLSDEKPPQAFTWNGTKPYWRGGPWDGWKFIGIEDEDKGYANGISLTTNNQIGASCMTFNNFNKSYISIMVILPTGMLEILHWEGQQNQWNVSWAAPQHPCDVYGTCGPFSSCSKSRSPPCECLKGFFPLSNEEWSKGNWTSGCVRGTQLMCDGNSSNLISKASKPDGFWKLSHMKLPDHYLYLYDETDQGGCSQWCLSNCSCLAYACPDGIGCMVWVTDLVDIQQFSNDGEDLYLRLANTELGVKKRYTATIISVLSISVGSLLGLLICCVKRWRANRRDISQEDVQEGPASAKRSSELPIIDFKRVKRATNNFSEANKLGEGGFGAVYKGKLEDGQLIAVKRLSTFKSLRTRHGGIVILEYMKNKSLDKFLFVLSNFLCIHRTKRLELDWAKRFNIIQGIARGLLYLHRDSCLRIIHRDLKASNILLDDDMNPKISDFGLARTFRVTQELANTLRVVGTFGYMSPEYAMGGLFSEKSDVYSFGVLLLEIVSSKKNTGFGYHEKYLNLLGYAWQLWNECKAPELLDPSLADSCTPAEVMRCIQIGLLCVQDHAADRPTMSNVVLMLSSSESEMELPQPRQPTFTFQSLLESEHFQSGVCTFNVSTNEVSISLVEAGASQVVTRTRARPSRYSHPADGRSSGANVKSTGPGEHLLLLVFYNILFILPVCCASNDTITPSQPLKVGQTLISARQIFELGFFSPGKASELYVGIWYKFDPGRRIVWVANRENALSARDLASRLIISSDGNLKLLDGKQNTIWSTNASAHSNSTIAVLRDDGDFILEDNVSGATLWESFYYPSDTVLPNMTGMKNVSMSWENENDPAPGNFFNTLSDEKPPQAFTCNGTKPYWRGGPWNGWQFIGIPDATKGYANGMSLIPNNQTGAAYMTFSTFNESYIYIMVILPTGMLELLQWEGQQNQWNRLWAAPQHPCDVYGTCGPFTACSMSGSPICECLKGFYPQSNEEWSKGNWTSGCLRRTELMCTTNSSNLTYKASKPDGFWKLSQMKLPDHYLYLYDKTDQGGCSQWCLSNCSCLAYAYPDGIGCMVWVTHLVDIQQFSDGGEDLYLRLANSELGVKKRYTAIIISVLSISVGLLVGLLICCIKRWKANRRDISQEDVQEGPASAKGSSELPIINFNRVKRATNNFSEADKLGEGGFGAVYKGKLEDGQLIAVKRLSSHSGQGMEEFKNEVMLISKLQHRNLVRLLGYCIQGEEKIVILEYMKNKSLDKFLFDRTKRLKLDWAKRFNILQGIARGLLYLHRDSCLRIIHRDLKASNILLDDDMIPKISDFGLARTFRVTQELANTLRVVGTFGYMSPEYAMGGLFSEKSDVYSFGVLLLEIISSKKNTGFGYHEKYLNLLGYAWQLWNDCKAPELLDPSLADSCTPAEVIRCIQIGLLCVQDHAADRPTMSNVVLMLSSSESEMELPQPRQPTFTFQSLLESEHFQSGVCTFNVSTNEVSISLVEGR